MVDTIHIELEPLTASKRLTEPRAVPLQERIARFNQDGIVPDLDHSAKDISVGVHHGFADVLVVGDQL